MKKLVGASQTRLARMPPVVEVSARATEAARARTGRVVSRWAAAAGVTMRVSTSSTPVTWMVAATAAASRTMNSTAGARTGTPRAAAASGSTEANHSGRPAAASTTSTAPATIARCCSWVSDTAVIDPNSSPKPVVA